MIVRYPDPLRPGDRVGVTAPSSGVDDGMQERLKVAIREVEARGYEVVVGECMDGTGHLSAPAHARARELMAMLTDPDIRAVVPPWGGETAIDLLPLLDWEAVRAADPTWLVGFSDISTIITPLTLLTGVATVHGNNLMDTPYHAPEGLLTWLDIVALQPGATFTQTPPNRHRGGGWVDYRNFPEVRELTLDTPGGWTRLDADGPVEVEGRLIGGCIETMCNLAGTTFGDVASFARAAAPEGLLVYVEAAEDDAPPSAATSTACGWPASSRRRTRSSWVARQHPESPRSRSTRRCSTPWAASVSRSLPMSSAVTCRRTCRS